jgi:lipoprotein-releasing system permease protein
MKEAFSIAQKIRKSSGPSVIKPLLRLSTYATALGMALVILSITSGKGLQKAINDEFRALEGDINISEYSIRRTGENGPILLSDSLKTVFSENDLVKDIHGEIRKASLVVNPKLDAFEGIEIIGYDSIKLHSFLRDFSTISTLFNSRYGIYVSSTLLSKLALSVGDTAILVAIKDQRSAPRLRDAVVLGAFETGLDEFNTNHVIMDINDVRRLNGWRNDSVTHYSVLLQESENRNIVAAYWNAIVPYNLQVQSLEFRHPAIFGWLKLFDTNILLVLSIVLIVAIVNLCIALLVLIIDRTRMIGTLKAMGASDSLILQIFMWLSIRILIHGLIWGNLIGLGASFLQWYFGLIKLDPTTYYISTAPIYFDYFWILTANLAFILVAFVVLRFPVRWISKLDPIKSIRFS